MASALPNATVKDFKEVEQNFEALAKLLGPLTGAVMVGTGSPENVVTAPVGTIYRRADGGANTTLYVKESGSSNTGWTAK